MKYAIIGSGNIGAKLAESFAQHSLEVWISNSRGAETITELAISLGSTVNAKSLEDALTAEIIILAVPFLAHKDIAAKLPNWESKIIVDAMNTLDLSPEQRKELGTELSSEVVEKAFIGARW